MGFPIKARISMPLCFLLIINIVMPLLILSVVDAATLQLNPMPQEIIHHGLENPVRLTSSSRIVDFSQADQVGQDTVLNFKHAIANLQANQKDRGLNLKTIKAQEFTWPGASSPNIVFCPPDRLNRINELLTHHQISVAPPPFTKSDSRYLESYNLFILNAMGQEQIVIVSWGSAGAFYAVQTLVQLVSPTTWQLPSVSIIDYPDMQWRGIVRHFKHRPCKIKFDRDRSPGKRKACIEDEIKGYAHLKLNTIFFSDPVFWGIDQTNLPLLTDIFETCRKYHMTPIPVLDSKLWGIPRKQLAMDAIEGIWIKDTILKVDAENIAQSHESRKDLILNGSFEKASDDRHPSNWGLTQLDAANRWHRVGRDGGTQSSQTVHSGNFGLACDFNHLSRPWRLNLKPSAHRTQADLVKIKPSSYYELNFWARNGSPPGGNSIRVSVKQFSPEGRQLKNGGNHINNFHLGDAWKSFWFPLFTVHNAAFIAISFHPSPIGPKSGKLYLDDVHLHLMNGALINVLSNDETKITVYNENATREFKTGVDFIIQSGPTYASPQKSFAELQATRIKRTPNSRIKPGEVLKVSYDCLPLSPRSVPRSKYCPSSRFTYEAYQAAIRDLLSLNPKYIHLSLDEHTGGYNRDSRCLKRNCQNSDLLSGFINNLHRLATESGPIEVLPGEYLSGLGRKNIKLVIWDDMLSYWHNGGNPHYQEMYGGLPGETYLAMPGTPFHPISSHLHRKNRSKLVHDIILHSWWYKKKDTKGIIAKAPDFFRSRNFDFIGCAWWDKTNILSWAKAIAENEGLGLTAATWSNNRAGVPIVAQYSWNDQLN